MTDYSPRALPEIDGPYKDYPEGWHHFYQRLKWNLPAYLEANKAYNLQFMTGPRIEQMLPYKRALVLGTGPSLDEVPDEVVRNYDGAVIMCQPLVRHYADILTKPNVFVADGEYEWFIVPYCYGEHSHKLQLICAIQHHLETTHPFRRIFYYDAEEGWPRSSGALAMKVALDVMGADTEYAGIDLTGNFEQFVDETTPYLKRARRWSDGR